MYNGRRQEQQGVTLDDDLRVRKTYFVLRRRHTFHPHLSAPYSLPRSCECSLAPSVSSRQLTSPTCVRECSCSCARNPEEIGPQASTRPAASLLSPHTCRRGHARGVIASENSTQHKHGSTKSSNQVNSSLRLLPWHMLPVVDHCRRKTTRRQEAHVDSTSSGASEV